MKQNVKKREKQRKQKKTMLTEGISCQQNKKFYSVFFFRFIDTSWFIGTFSDIV